MKETGKYSYPVKIKISVIIVLITTIAVFYFFPVLDTSNPVEEIISLENNYEFVPVTVQRISFTAQKPSLPEIPFYIPVDEPEILGDILIEETAGKLANEEKGTLTANNEPKVIYNPRQILEVLPKGVEENTRGTISLSLKIDNNGKVIEHKLLSNTTNEKNCLEKVLKAAYNSRWTPVTGNSAQNFYWVEKSYKFN